MRNFIHKNDPSLIHTLTIKMKCILNIINLLRKLVQNNKNEHTDIKQNIDEIFSKYKFITDPHTIPYGVVVSENIEIFYDKA